VLTLGTAWTAPEVILSPGAAKISNFKGSFSYAFLFRGDGGVCPNLSLLFAA
jgi:hypothetical protein